MKKILTYLKEIIINSVIENPKWYLEYIRKWGISKNAMLLSNKSDNDNLYYDILKFKISPYDIEITRYDNKSHGIIIQKNSTTIVNYQGVLLKYSQEVNDIIRKVGKTIMKIDSFINYLNKKNLKINLSKCVNLDNLELFIDEKLDINTVDLKKIVYVDSKYNIELNFISLLFLLNKEKFEKNSNLYDVLDYSQLAKYYLYTENKKDFELMINTLKENVLNDIPNSKEILLDCLFAMQNVAILSVNEWEIYSELTLDYENKYGNVILKAIKDIDYSEVLPKYLEEKICHIILNYNVNEISDFIIANTEKETISKAILKDMEYIVSEAAHKIPVRLEELKNLIKNNKISFHDVADIETILRDSKHSADMYEHYLIEIKKIQVINDNNELLLSVSSMNTSKNNTKIKL